MALSSNPPTPAATRGKTLLHVLFEKKRISMEQGKEAANRKNGSSDSLEKILEEMGVSDVHITEAQAELQNVPFVDLTKTKPTDEAAGLVPEEMQDRYDAIPIRVDDKTLTIAMADPKNVFAIDDLRAKTGMQIKPVMVAPSQLDALKNGTIGLSDGISLNGDHGSNGSQNGDAAAVPSENTINLDGTETWAQYDDNVGEMVEGLKPAQKLDDIKKGDEAPAPSLSDGTTELDPNSVVGGEALADEAPIIRIVNTVLLYALKDGASDIHIEPQQKGVRIRYRIDGVLHEQMKIPQYVLNPLISRVKIMAEMNIAERRVPQDGRIKLTMQGKEYDMRVNSCPTVFGEKIVLRVLDKSSVMLGLDKIGLYQETQDQLLDICNQPNGMLMICGPTGSGKTTTLYSILNVVNSVEKNVMTVEDPVEYQLPGLSQVHVNRKAGLSFAAALRAFLRQDPDVIMVGEIRDLETAEIAIQASLTGHLVLSTVHTNDAPSTATRLADMGVEPFLISASMTGALAQRLARRICSNCKEPDSPPREILLRFGFDPLKNPDVQFYKGRGCDRCKQTGYKGRVGVYELMRINEELQELIVRRAPLNEIKDAARANGMHTLQEDGFSKCKDGWTTVEEVMRVIFTGGH